MKDLPEARLRHLAQHGRRRHVAKGEKFGSAAAVMATAPAPSPATASTTGPTAGPGARWFVVQSGCMALEQEDPLQQEDGLQGPQRCGELGPGDAFGGLEALTGAASPFQVRALKGGVVLELDAESLAELRREDPALALELAVLMGDAPLSAVWSNKAAGQGTKTTAPQCADGGHVRQLEAAELSEIQLHAVKHALCVIENLWQEMSTDNVSIHTAQLLSVQEYLGEVGEELFKKLFTAQALPETLTKTNYWDIWMSFLTTEVYPYLSGPAGPGLDLPADTAGVVAAAGAEVPESSCKYRHH